MPGMLVHHWLVSKLLNDPECAGVLPTAVVNRSVVDSIYLGSIAHDMGAYPGGNLFISNLAHYIRTGELCQTLLGQAQTPADLAFAWGWVTHHVADTLFHPLINRGVGELLLGRRDLAVSFAECPAAHVSVEIGLDVEVFQKYGTQAKIDWSAIAINERVDQLTQAYQSTYGKIDVRSSLQASLKATRRWSWAWSQLVSQHSLCGSPSKSIRRKLLGVPITVCRSFTSLLPSRTPVRGLFRPQAPTEWMRKDFEQLVEQFLETMHSIIRLDRPSIPDTNLDTGKFDRNCDTYPLSIATKAALGLMLRKPTSLDRQISPEFNSLAEKTRQ